VLAALAHESSQTDVHVDVFGPDDELLASTSDGNCFTGGAALGDPSDE
jgi:hypothetical protein